MATFPLDCSITAVLLVFVVIGRETGQNRNIQSLQTEDKRRQKREKFKSQPEKWNINICEADVALLNIADKLSY